MLSRSRLVPPRHAEVHRLHGAALEIDGAHVARVRVGDEGGLPVARCGDCARLSSEVDGEATRAHRHTGSFIYQVAKGSGHSVIDGKRFDWKERDIFCVPSWAWHEHANASASDDACLFAFNDLPVMHALGLYREEAFGDNEGRQQLS